MPELKYERSLIRTYYCSKHNSTNFDTRTMFSEVSNITQSPSYDHNSVIDEGSYTDIFQL